MYSEYVGSLTPDFQQADTYFNDAFAISSWTTFLTVGYVRMGELNNHFELTNADSMYHSAVLAVVPVESIGVVLQDGGNICNLSPPGIYFRRVLENEKGGLPL